MKTVQVGLIGCGVMGCGLAKALTRVEGARLVVVSDPDRQAAEKLGQELGVPAVTDLGRVLRRRGLHAVIGAPPPFKHREVAVAAARAGKHLFIEKPLAACLPDADAILRAAKRARVKLMVGHVCRYHPVHRKVRDLVAEGAIGRPLLLHVYRLGGPWGGIWAKSWRLSREMSGGTLMEVNAHEIDFMRFVFGDVRSVYAAGGNFLEKRADFPDLALLTLKFQSGAMGFLHSSQVSALGGYGCRVDGHEGSLLIPSFWGEAAGVQHKRWEGENRFIPASDLKGIDAVQAELTEWIEAVRGDTPAPVSGEDGRAAVEIAEAAYASIETGRAVELGRGASGAA
ncbi:MAG: Gfo/Idh/MocA family oxidoreductase [Planctomycetes bacterium]|nr:Gfo/Idh/MocA family oxidoreductase [Planctomycetota bacterium]